MMKKTARNTSTSRTSSQNSTFGTQQSDAQQPSTQRRFGSKKPLTQRSKSRLGSAKVEPKVASRKQSIPDDKKLRVIGHQLQPCVSLSESSIQMSEETASLSDTVLAEIRARLEDHELIKIKIYLNDREDRQQVLDMVLEATGTRKIQQIGKIALLFKASSRFSTKLSNIERHRHLI